MFKTFPEFSKLTLDHRAEYERLTRSYSPVGDISFASLLLWWDAIGELSISRLGDNFVVAYWIPGDEDHSGLSLIGVSKVDQAVCAIFDYLRDKGERPRLVNVPEFVVNSLQYPELFNFRTDRGDDEYLISLAKFANPRAVPSYMRLRIEKFLRQTESASLQLKDLDLGDPVTQRVLLEVADDWPLKGINNIAKLEREVLPNTIKVGTKVAVQCIGLFVGLELEAYCLYYLSHDGQYVLIPHARVNYEIAGVFDYFVHACAKYFIEQEGARSANIHADTGSLRMRALKIALKPDNFFRKYTLEPVG